MLPSEVREARADAGVNPVTREKSRDGSEHGLLSAVAQLTRKC